MSAKSPPKANTTPKPKASPKSERWEKYDPSWMWEREIPPEAATKENAVLYSRRVHGK